MNINKLKEAIIKRKRLFAILLAGIIGTITIVSVATTLPLNNDDYTSEYSKRSWDESEYNKKNPGFIPTGLGANETYIWPLSGKGDDYPLGAIRYLEKRAGYTTPDEFAKFDNQYIYCVANHVANYTLTRGMQAFSMQKLTALTPFEDCVGTGDVKKFNFIMLAIACNYGTENSDYKPNEANNAYYGIASQAIAWVNTASTAEQAFGVIQGKNFTEDLAAFRNQPIYRAVMNNSFPESTHPSIYRQLHAPSTGWHAAAGCKNWFESVFADVWNSAKLTEPMNIDWEAEKSTLTGQVESGDDGYYHMYLNVFQSEEMKQYLNGISFKAIKGSDWTLVEQTAEGIMHFKSPTGEMPEGGSIGVLTWPNGVLGGLMPKDLSSAKLYTFTFYSPDPKTGEYGFGKTQTHFGSVIDKDLEVYITTGHDDTPEGEVTVQRYKHTEDFSAAYNINLNKFDSETGKPLTDAHFDILESFDDSQLDATSLDLLNADGYVNHLGSLNNTEWAVDDIESNYNGDLGLSDSDANLYNWSNDNGTQFERWDDPYNDPCDRDDNVTNENGELYEINSNGSISNTKAHIDVKKYTYEKGYCGGHPAPVIEYQELTGDEEVDEEIEEENQALHDAMWAAWYKEVEKCEALAQQGGFFHAIEAGIAKKALEEDRDQFYKDFISLTYEYSAEEISASKGYIIHGTHTDEIPIEVRVVTSSEYKDTNMAEDIDHTGSSSGGEDESEPEIYNSSKEYPKENYLYEDEKDINGTDVYLASPSNATYKHTTEEEILKDESNTKADFVFETLDNVEEENENLEDTEMLTIASPSDAEKASAEIMDTGLTENIINKSSEFAILSANDEGEDSPGGNLRKTTSFKNSEASVVVPPDDSIVDWTFIVYNHRTEGEIHINKRDFNLNNQDNNNYSAYAQANSDGTLEGAVYGLFASTDIVHPDGHTGVVFKKDNLVSVTTTDRNGNASFMAITEGPGYTFDYQTGMIQKTNDNWADNAPKNLYTNQADADVKEVDNESFIGHDTSNNELELTDSSYEDDTCYKKHSSNQGVDETGTDGAYYPIQNNEDNNGNSWIGRPLIVSKEGSQYYIKELSRSEGYELSVYGKDEMLLTNKDAFAEGGNDFASGTISTSKIEMDKDNGGNTFTISSVDTTDGYNVVLNNIPEGATFYITKKEQIWDDSVSHKEQQIKEEPVYAEEGSLVMADGHTWEADLGETIVLSNGKSFKVNNVYTVENSKIVVKPSNTKKIENPNLQPDVGSSNYLDEINKAFLKSKFKVPSDEAPWVLVPFSELNSESIAEAVNSTIFTDDYYSVFNAMSLAGTTAIKNQKYAIITYDYIGTTNTNALYNTLNDSIYVKKAVKYNSNTKTYDGYVWKAYSNYSDEKTNENGFVISACVTNESIINGPFEWHKDNLDNINYEKIKDDTYWAYASGEQQIGINGELVTKQVITEIDVTPTLITKVTDSKLNDITYANGVYQFHIDQETAKNNSSIEFRILYDNDSIKINGVTYPADLYAYSNGIISAMLPTVQADSYIVEVFLTYPGEKIIISDAGTILTPKLVLERPIRQKVKVVKDIQTNEDGSYAHDTYSENHSDNSIDALGRYNQASTDWLTNLKNGEVENNSTSKIPEFRFKAYLKSNLERLYRDENGTIVWLDRNGNALVPEYQDTDGDGNHETFVWKSGEHTTDFPEVDKMDGNKLTSANVQKLYTKVEHNLNSTTTGDISNNVWASYADPQTGDSKNVGELRADNTSQDGTNGEAVKTNGALYSYDGKNTNVAESDRINPNANTGYTRLLETRVETVEDGTGSRDVEQYNYEKFFDAMAAANTDKWDNDMFASKKNYPGQHWFETFEEKYQKDDADPDGTIENTDGVDADGTAGGDRDTSFKPFQWIREKIFGTTQDAKDDYPATHDNDNLENVINTSAIAHSNAEASDAVRQFAITWYLDDEVAKLVRNNGYDEDVAIKGSESYQEEVYDLALEQALIKTYNYLKPFYEYDLDTIYSVMWDSAENGGTDQDVTTLSADTLYEKQGAAGEQGQSKDGYYYGVSAYLPYGTYVLVEQQPYNAELDDFDNKHYKIDKPKELILPSVYEENGNVGAPEVFNQYYEYKSTDTPVDLAKKYMIRFNEEWANNHTDDLRNYVIRAHNFDGDYEIYKYGLDVDKLISEITYNNTAYNYDGFSITQELNDPLKDYYNNPLVDTVHDGGNANSHYFADDKNKGVQTANGSTYAEDAIEKRYHYGSISEHSGEASDVLYQHGPDKDDNNPSGFFFKDKVKTMTGNQTAYDEKYASMLVPWSVVEPAESDVYDITNFTGYADSKFRNTFYTSKLRIEKLDSETGEQILHDDAIFAIYAAARDDSKDGDGEVLFYEVDTAITGSKEFLEAMSASNIQTLRKGVGELYSGIVKAGTPICYEEDQIFMTDAEGNRTGTFQVFATNKDGQVVSEDKDEKEYANQNVGYLVTPQPLGAGVYVLVEINPPTGYSRTSPVAIEIYSDKVSYYMNGDKNNKVIATIYENNLFK